MASPRVVLRFLAPDHAARLLLALLLLAFLAAGCATAPSAVLTDPPAEPPIPLDAVGPEFTEFLNRLLSVDERFNPASQPQFLLLLDLDRMPDVVQEFHRRDLLDRRTLDRADMVIAAGSPGEPVSLWVSGRYPRFWTAIALSSRGWRRLRPFVWHDGDGTEVTLLGDGVIRLDFPWTDQLNGPDTHRVVTTSDDGSSIREVLERLYGEPVFVFFVNDPDERVFFGDIDLGTLQPRDVLVTLNPARNVELAIRFAGEREARVVLVAMRIAHRQILQTMNLVAGPEFAVVRQGVEVRLSGAGATDESVRTLLDRIPTTAADRDTAR